MPTARPPALLLAMPKRSATAGRSTGDGLAGPISNTYSTFDLKNDWAAPLAIIQAIDFEPSSRPAVSGKGECLGLRAQGQGHTITHTHGHKNTAAMALNWSLRNEPAVQDAKLVWTSWQINVDSVSSPPSGREQPRTLLHNSNGGI